MPGRWPLPWQHNFVAAAQLWCQRPWSPLVLLGGEHIWSCSCLSSWSHASAGPCCPPLEEKFVDQGQLIVISGERRNWKYQVWNWKCQVRKWKCQFKKVKVKHIAVWCCRNRQSDQIRENEVFARPFQHIIFFLRQQWKCLSTKISKDAVWGWKVWLARNWSCLETV